MKNIVFVEVEDWERGAIDRILLKKFKAKIFSQALDELNNKELADIEILSTFIYSKVGKEELEKMPKLEAIATRSTGTDHIDFKECKKRGIKVYNVPTYGENTVAEHTFGLILSLSRKIYQAIQRGKRADFSINGLQGFDLKGKTIGIIGMGYIGKHVARIAKGFEMNIIAFDIKENKQLAKELGFKHVSFEFLLENSDVISLHAPYNKKTHHMINSKNIDKIKKGAILVNTARGGLVETNALLKALEKGIISAAGLDVLEEEAFIKEESQLLSSKLPKKQNLKVVLQNHVLMGKDNVLITPHNAFNSKEAIERIIQTTVKNIKTHVEKDK